MNEELRREIDRFAAENEQAIFADIAKLVSVNSENMPALPGKPFGEGPAKALDTALEIARGMGLQTENCEGMIGYAQLGEGGRGCRDYLATITHLDVVPVGEGWTADPFAMREREGWIIGRGVLDDKGPSVLCLYALKYLKEHEIPLRYPVRALLGVNGIYHGRAVASARCENIVDFRGGFAANAIPDKAEAWVRAEELESAGRVTAEKTPDGLWHLTATGVGGHASMPEGTVNAIGVLIDYLLERGVCAAGEEAFLRFMAKIHAASDGSACGIAASDGLFEPLTVVCGVIGMEDGRLYQTIDSRYPTNTSGEKIAAILNALAAGAATVTVERDTTPFYMSLDKPEVQVCIDAYNAITGENAKPYTIGGGTYARDFPNAVSFGPEHPERPAPAFAGPIHGVDEAACKDWLIEALKVYILALIELEKLEF